MKKLDRVSKIAQDLTKQGSAEATCVGEFIEALVAEADQFETVNDAVFNIVGSLEELQGWANRAIKDIRTKGEI